MRPIIIPLFAGKPSHPSVPLGRMPAGARSGGQGRPQAGATRAPFTEASTLAGWRLRGVGSCAAAALLAMLPIAASPAFAQRSVEPIARSSASHPYAPHVAAAARRFGIPEAWIWAVMRVESGGNPRAVSRAGAMGLMQIMPATWAELRARYGLGSDPFDVRDNVMAGAAYLREMHDRYGSASAMLAAYNAGPGRYDDYLARGRPLPAETVSYLAQLASVTGTSREARVAPTTPPDPFAWRRAALFVRTAAGAFSAASMQPGDELAAADPLSESSAARDESVSEPTPETPVDGLFVPRARAGRPQ